MNARLRWHVGHAVARGPATGAPRAMETSSLASLNLKTEVHAEARRNTIFCKKFCFQPPRLRVTTSYNLHLELWDKDHPSRRHAVMGDHREVPQLRRVWITKMVRPQVKRQTKYICDLDMNVCTGMHNSWCFRRIAGSKSSRATLGFDQG